MESKVPCKYLIYMATSPSGRSYIGYTKHSLATRKLGHEKNVRNPSAFQLAITKYGKHSIIWKILEKNIKSRQLAQVREVFYIKKFNTYECGYNLTLGGDGLNPNDYKTKKKISSTLKKYHQQPGIRSKHSKERGGKRIDVFKAITIQEARGFDSKRKKTIKRGKLVGTFESQILCAEALGLSESKICGCLKTVHSNYRRLTHRGYCFRYSK